LQKELIDIVRPLVNQSGVWDFEAEQLATEKFTLRSKDLI
jgi:hypothetical protein